MPVISDTDITRRVPSGRRASCKTTLIPEAICWRTAEIGISPPIIATICSRRESASRAVFAWIVVIDPSWPVFMACSISNASAPRTSPTMILSGRIRRAFRTRSRCVTAAAPSILAGRVSSRTTCSCFNCNSAASSIVTMRWRGSMKAESAFSIVVLPDPVPPEIRTFRRASIRAVRTRTACSESAPRSTNRSSVRGSRENLRMESVGPSMAQGRMMAFTRLPSSRRASTQGWLSSTRRPTRLTILSMIRKRCRSSRNCTGTRSRRPFLST